MTAAASSIEAVMLVLRSNGTSALEEPKVRRWLSELDDSQMFDVAGRLQNLKSHIAKPWSDDELQCMFEAREGLDEHDS
jgi:hypothetical protein